MTMKTQSIFLFYMQFNANTTRDRANNDDIAEPTMRTSITTIINFVNLITIIAIVSWEKQKGNNAFLSLQKINFR